MTSGIMNLAKAFIPNKNKDLKDNMKILHSQAYLTVLTFIMNSN